MNDQRLIWLDSLRIIAGLSMVGLHSTADAMGQPWVDYAPAERIAPLLVRAIVYTARTELFLIISAFLLLISLDRRERSYVETLAEQAKRLLIPFVFWTVFYAFFNLIKASEFGYFDAAFNDISTVKSWMGYLVLGDVKYHMHFLPTLFCLLLFYPFFRLASAYPTLGLFVIIFLLARWELDSFLYQNFWGAEALGYLIRLVKVFAYIGYGMLAGAAVGIWKKYPTAQLHQWFPLVLLVGCLLFLFKSIATIKTIQSGVWQFNYVPGYWADFLMPVVLFLGCMSLASKSWPAVISSWARYSFGIYLCHPIFLDFSEILLRSQSHSPGIQVVLKLALCLPCTIGFVKLLSVCRPLAWTIGLGPLPFTSSAYFRRRTRDVA